MAKTNNSNDWSWNGKEVLITGGTGYLGRNLIKTFLSDYNLKGIRCYSRNEENQRKLKIELETKFKKNISFLIGDARDYYRLERAMNGVDITIHTAAMKQIPSCLYNPRECVLTNIMGSQNVVDAAINCKVDKAILISTDKACHPATFYGATKSCAEGLFINGNVYTGNRNPYFSCVRYGNVLNSTGSVIPLFEKQYKENGTITLTDERMTRFWISITKATKLVIESIETMKGGEIFIPKLPSSSVIDLIKVIVPDAKIKKIGIRSNEKIHEELISLEESRNIIEKSDSFTIMPTNQNHREFTYTSYNNPLKMNLEKLEKFIERYDI